MTQRALLLGLFSGAILAAEIALTRIFSVIFWYHFGFLILSTAMLGFGLGGFFVRLLKDRLSTADPDRVVGFGVALSGLTLAGSLFVVTHNHFSPLYVDTSLIDLWRLLVATIALVPPFTLMGGTVLFMLQRFSGRVSILYAANLIGSGIGCLAVLWLLDLVGGLLAFVILAAAMAFMGGVFMLGRWAKGAAIALVAALLILATLIATASFYPLKSPTRKFVAWVQPENLVFSDWTSLSKLDIYKEFKAHALGFGLWGLSPVNSAPLPERLGVAIDYWAYTTIIKHSEEPGYYDWLESMPMTMAYRLLDAPKTLIIGSGGGMDIRSALNFGASDIDAVEINPAIYRAMTEDLREYSGGVYTNPPVKAHLAEGRRFVENSRTQYDLIQLSGVDTYSATQAGAFALSENFLYTMEAMASYYHRLATGGILTLTRWYGPSPAGEPRFSMRLFTLAVESLVKRGITDPGRHIIFFRSNLFTVILIKLEPFTSEEIATVEADMEKHSYTWLFRPDGVDPGRPECHYYSDYINAPDREAWLAAYRFNVAPPTDDSPFFFEHRKLRHILAPASFAVGFSHGLDGQSILVLLLLEMVLVGLALIAASWKLQKSRTRIAGWIYFASIGLGFMLVEVALSQRLVLFLGHPAYALSVVLFSMLIFSGVGSLASNRLTARIPAVAILAGVVVYWLAWSAFGSALLQALIAAPNWERMIVGVLIIAPGAMLMGTAFPVAVRRLNDSGETELGLYWAFNGVASVTASVLAVIVAVGSGFSSVMLIAAGCYALAAVLLPRLSRS